jgi:CO dehydrogenase/acetyl-CoA synthase delta subunit
MKKLMLLAGLFLLTIIAKAQTADEVVTKYLSAIGGADKWKKLESMRQTGFVVVQGMNIPFTSTQARPNMTRQEGDFQGQKFIDAYDGTEAWVQSPWQTMNKPTKKTEEETKEAAKENFEDDFIDYATKGHSIELEGTEEIEGSKCFKVKLKRKVGDEKIYFFDSENYVPLVIRSFISTGPMKGQAVEMVMSDYKEVDGIMVPHTMEQKMNGQVGMTIKAEKVELNPVIDKTIFSFPSDKKETPSSKN